MHARPVTPRMIVNVDEQIFSAQHIGGISRYAVELMRAYSSDERLGVQLAQRLIWTQNVHLLEAGMGRRLPGQLGKHGRITARINRTLFRGGVPDVVHHTYYDRHYLRRHKDVQVRAVTIYDMIPELSPGFFPEGNPHRDKRSFVDAADLILCISKSTRRDLIEVYGRPEAPIVVTPLGVDRRFRPEAPRPACLPECYVLFVGTRSGYKDFSVLARAFAEASIPNDVMLVAVGGGAFDAGELATLAGFGISKQVVRVDLADEELAGAYSNAICLAFPSRYEGFGLPTLEAMASGCPPVLARASAHPEVGGDAAVYFSPGDHDELASCIFRMVTDQAFREERRLAGLHRAASFSWGTTARLTAAAYREALATAER